ncbi:hypothetical protein NUW54_g414 [Trametes sanguinea]|uniref:Uncharacterized protein n=1 Tax=Trametes sanguinea TaxID=158606 RepID=A0ACC1QB42_9APHY|nr:hypothetical protein NUW54_g414 [Trametes sanguinea]
MLDGAVALEVAYLTRPVINSMPSSVELCRADDIGLKLVYGQFLQAPGQVRLWEDVEQSRKGIVPQRAVAHKSAQRCARLRALFNPNGELNVVRQAIEHVGSMRSERTEGTEGKPGESSGKEIHRRVYLDYQPLDHRELLPIVDFHGRK